MSDNADHELIRNKIVDCLTVYGKLSPSMLQLGIGSSLPSTMWRPILEEMVAAGKVRRTEVPFTNHKGHNRVYTVLELVTE